MKTSVIIITTLMIITSKSWPVRQNCVEKNRMEVCWEWTANEVKFTLSAPIQGWVGIGFNDRSGLAGMYLLMARVRNGVPEVVEHYTHAPGRYEPIENLGVQPSVTNVSGKETQRVTEISFTIPVMPEHEYGKDLIAGKSYEMLIAYSRDDDFQHHSMMRSSIGVEF